MSSNISANESLVDSSTTEFTGLNYILVSIDKCSKRNPIFYCYYSSLLIFLGYVCMLLISPLTLLRINKLKNRFRNQYNLSFLWICSILLIIGIDLLEFGFLRDNKLYSIAIVIFMIINFFSNLILAAKYMKIYSKEGSIYKQSLTIIFSIILFGILLFSRLFSKNRLSKFSVSDKNIYHYVNTHLFLYYFVYILFGFAQVHQNFRKKFARCFSNASYALWILGAFLLSFYSSILPSHPAYDFVHFRNYFLMTTIIVIILQDLNFYRIDKNKNANKILLNSVSLKQIRSNKQNVYSNSTSNSKKFVFTENAFSSDKNLASNQDDETLFDVRVYNNNKETSHIQSEIKESVPEFSIENDIKANESRRLEEFYINNQKFLIICFVIILLIQFFVSSYIMVISTSKSIYQVVTILIHPIIILTSKVLNHYDVNLIKK